MQSRNTTLLLIIGTLLAGVLMLFKVMTSPTGGLAGLIKYAAVPMVLVCFLYPRSGLVLISFMSFYGDFYKKLAVYYGKVSLDTVIEVLAVSVAMVGATLAGAVVLLFLRGLKPDRTSVILCFLTIVLTGFIMASGGDEGIAGRVQYAVNSGLYLGLAAVICLFCIDREDALKLCRLHYWLAVPWAIWAWRQYEYGFTDMEWGYAATKLSPVLYEQMFMTPDTPRVYGFGSTAPAFGVIAFLFCFGIWHAYRYAHARIAFLFCTMILAVGLYVSQQRTMMLIPPLVAGSYFLLRTKGGTIFFYTSCVSSVVAMVAFAELALGNLESANAAIEGQSGWANRVIRISTFADRLKGWSRLTRASSYSLFGTRWKNKSGSGKEFADEEYNHDSINKVLINYGIVGLGAAGIALVILVWQSHKTVLGIRDPMDRDAAVFVLSLMAVAGALTMMGGNNLHTPPINLVVVTYLGLAAGVIRRNREEAEERSPDTLVAPAAAQPVQPISAPMQRHPLRPHSRWH